LTLLEMTGVSKHFGGVRALESVDLSVEEGEVRALVGENGSGKTTLMRILAGVIAPDEGSVSVGGTPLADLDATARLREGVGVVFQEAQVCPDLTVGENMLLGRIPARRGVIRWRTVHGLAQSVLDQAGLPLDSSARVRSISQDAQHLTEVARVIANDCRILVFDETTASLTIDHVDRLFRLIRRKRDEGCAVVFITHRLHEAFELCDSVTVLRDGQVTATRPMTEVDEEDVIRLMVGRSLERQYFRPPSDKREVLLSVEALGSRSLEGVDLEVHGGEVIGIAGLVGSGRSTLLRSIYGLEARTGNVEVAGVAVPAQEPRASIDAGMGFIPENRRTDGLAMEQTVRANASMVITGRRSLLAAADVRGEKEVVAQLFDRLGLRAAGPDAPLRTLSGGNQQKVVLGRWLAHRPKVLLLDEPTRGIDVGAKSEIYDLIHALSQDGTAILIVSSELPELLGLCDRILVLREGRAIRWFERGVDEESLASAMAASLATRPTGDGDG
jgi:ABC-type sugar transport system ATPase subunit